MVLFSGTTTLGRWYPPRLSRGIGTIKESEASISINRERSGSISALKSASRNEQAFIVTESPSGKSSSTDGVVSEITSCLILLGDFVDNPASGRVMEKCGFVPNYGNVYSSSMAEYLY